MTPSNRFPKEALSLAHALTLQPKLWQCPQVEGITIIGLDSRDRRCDLDRTDCYWGYPFHKLGGRGVALSLPKESIVKILGTLLLTEP